MDGRVVRAALLSVWACLCALVGAAGLRQLWGVLSVPCGGDCPTPALNAGAALALEGLHIPLSTYAWMSVAVTGVLMGAVTVLAIAVALHGQGSAALLASAVLFAVTAAMGNPPGMAGSPLGCLGRSTTTAALIGMVWLFAAFPRRSPMPRWLWAPVAVGGLWALATHWLPPLRAAIADEQAPWVPLEGIVFSAVFLAIAVGRIAAYGRESAAVQRQLRMVVAAIGVLCLLGLAGSLSTAALPGAGAGTLAGALWYHLGAAAVVMVIGAMGVSFISHNAWGTGTLLSAAVTAGIATGLFAFVCACAATVLAVVLSAGLPWPVSMFVTTAVVVLVLPAARQWVGRRVFGNVNERADLSGELASILVRAPSPASVVPAMELLLARRLRFPALVIHAPAEPPKFARGRAAVVLRDAGSEVPVAHLEVSLRKGRRRLTRHERVSLQSAATPIGAALALLRMTRELAESQAALAAVREEERKVLRRTLHDDVVPTLAMARHRISAARSHAPGADEHLDWAQSTIDSAIEQLRLVARALRPTVLSAHGLRDAVEHFAVGVNTPVELTLQLGRTLPAQLELAAYQVVVEAVLNAERHAGATLITVVLASDDTGLDLTVRDNGAGIQAGGPAGLGLDGMHETVSALGGELRISHGQPRGTAVFVRLPHPQGSA